MEKSDPEGSSQRKPYQSPELRVYGDIPKITRTGAERSSQKKPYQSPELRVYGDIHKITRGTPRVEGRIDNVRGHATKTG